MSEQHHPLVHMYDFIRHSIPLHLQCKTIGLLLWVFGSFWVLRSGEEMQQDLQGVVAGRGLTWDCLPLYTLFQRPQRCRAAKNGAYTSKGVGSRYRTIYQVALRQR